MHIVKYRKSIRNLNNLHLRGLLFVPLGRRQKHAAPSTAKFPYMSCRIHSHAVPGSGGPQTPGTPMVAVAPQHWVLLHQGRVVGVVLLVERFLEHYLSTGCSRQSLHCCGGEECHLPSTFLSCMAAAGTLASILKKSCRIESIGTGLVMVLHGP